MAAFGSALPAASSVLAILDGRFAPGAIDAEEHRASCSGLAK
jgi:hypothetical protein